VGDHTDVFPLKVMQERLLAELEKFDCNEAEIEFEALDILFSMQKGEFSTSNLPSQTAKRRSRSRSSSPKEKSSASQPKKEKHRRCQSQSSESLSNEKEPPNPLKFSAFLRVEIALSALNF